MVRIFCSAALAVLSIVSSSAQDTWQSLQFKTGWIMIGMVDAESGKWVSQSPGFEILGKPRKIDDPVDLPLPGDRIRLRFVYGVVIVNFRTAGERDRFVSPGSKRTLDATDATGVRLPIGTLLNVQDRQTDDIPIEGLRQLWLRVAPSE